MGAFEACHLVIRSNVCVLNAQRLWLAKQQRPKMAGWVVTWQALELYAA